MVLSIKQMTKPAKKARPLKRRSKKIVRKAIRKAGKTHGAWHNFFEIQVSSAIALVLCLSIAGTAATAVLPAYNELADTGLVLAYAALPHHHTQASPQVLGTSTTTTAAPAQKPTMMQAADVEVSPAQDLPADVGVYFWDGQLDNVPAGQMLAKGQELADSLGVKTLRIFMSPKSDIDYSISNKCISNFTLAKLAARSDFKAILRDPQFQTIIITAYDGTTFGNCVKKNYMIPTFLTPTKLASVQTEYRGLATYLKQFNKTFIIDAWEGDNDLYCGDAFDATPGSCPGINDRITGYTKWMQARAAGIKSAKTANVFSAMEFNNVHSLPDQGMPNILYNVLPNVDVDYYSYSSYESINVSAAQLATDIDGIRASLSGYGKDPSHLFIGEFGFDSEIFGKDVAAQKVAETIAVARQKNIPYSILWNLIDNPTLGAFDTGGNLTAYGKALSASLPDPPTLDAAQGYNTQTGQYTDGFGYDNEYLIAYGNFSQTGNTVYVGGVAFTPDYEGANQINVKLDNTRLNAGDSSNQVQVYVSDADGQTSSPATFILAPENAIVYAEGYDAQSGQSSAGSADVSEYLLLFGNFVPSGNSVYINGTEFTPMFQSGMELVVPLQNSGKIQASLSGTPASVYVINSLGRTPEVTVKFYLAK